MRKRRWKRIENKLGPQVGSRRDVRQGEQVMLRARLLQRMGVRRTKRKDPTGLKVALVPGMRREEAAFTPYFAKERRRRQAARKVAHESRRRNRA